MRIAPDSIAYVHDSIFRRNRTNLPNHRQTSAGGGIYVGNGDLVLTNTRFENNEAGFAGGGVYIIASFVDPVSVPNSEVTVANCTFEDNRAERDPSVPPGGPTEGGGLHAEGQATVNVYNTRFIENHSENGGGLNLYRAIVEVEDSVFRGNRAFGTGTRGVGGAIQAISNDVPNDGAINRRTARLTVRRTLFQGRFGATTTGGLSGGCVFTIGDQSRQYGLNGITPMGTTEQNRTNVVIEDSVFFDCDAGAIPVSAGTGVAGGLGGGLSDVTLRRSLIANSDALGDLAAGGGARFTFESLATITDTTFARNTATTFGGGLLVQGAEIDASDCRFYENEISPGVNEAINESFGAAIWTGPIISGVANLAVNGQIRNSLISRNVGLPIFDGDRTNGPINDVRYNDNEVFNNTFGTTIYDNQLTPAQDVAGLNNLVVVRAGAPNTNKSQIANSALGAAPITGTIIATPTQLLDRTAAGDAMATTEAFVGFAWSGASAQLDGVTVTGNAGLDDVGTGVHTLQVGAVAETATVNQGATPAATLTASPTSVPPGGPSTLTWSVSAGTFLTAAVDNDVSDNAGASGMATVNVTCSTSFLYCVVTEEGGVAATAQVLVGSLFADGFESGDTSAWTDTVP